MANVIFFNGSMTELRELIPVFFGDNKPPMVVNSLNDVKLGSSQTRNENAGEGWGCIVINGVVTSEKFSPSKHLRAKKVGEYIDVKTKCVSYASNAISAGCRVSTKTIAPGIKRVTILKSKV